MMIFSSFAPFSFYSLFSFVASFKERLLSADSFWSSQHDSSSFVYHVLFFLSLLLVSLYFSFLHSLVASLQARLLSADTYWSSQHEASLAAIRKQISEVEEVNVRLNATRQELSVTKGILV